MLINSFLISNRLHSLYNSSTITHFLSFGYGVLEVYMQNAIKSIQTKMKSESPLQPDPDHAHLSSHNKRNYRPLPLTRIILKFLLIPVMMSNTPWY